MNDLLQRIEDDEDEMLNIAIVPEEEKCEDTDVDSDESDCAPTIAAKHLPGKILRSIAMRREPSKNDSNERQWTSDEWQASKYSMGPVDAMQFHSKCNATPTVWNYIEVSTLY